MDPLCLVWVSESPLLPEGRAPLGWAGKATEELRSEQQPRPGQVGRGRHASFSEKRAHYNTRAGTSGSFEFSQSNVLAREGELRQQRPHRGACSTPITLQKTWLHRGAAAT